MLGTYASSAYQTRPLPAERNGTMDYNELREHIESVAGRQEPGPISLAARLAASCWPSGSEDRTDPTALEWVRRWRPEKAGTPLPSCSCVTGRCGLCN
jgi:hypothetical protein